VHRDRYVAVQPQGILERNGISGKKLRKELPMLTRKYILPAILALLDLTKIKISLSATSLSTMTIYPVVFFALLELCLMYNGLRPLWRKKFG